MSIKKTQQLGMNPGTASHRLTKDILFAFIQITDNNQCFVCGKPMSREDFSIEHKVPWLDSADPVGLYFDLQNIAFSHHRCNVGSARQEPAKCGSKGAYAKGCRCSLCCEYKSKDDKKRYTKEKRQERYQRTGR